MFLRKNSVMRTTEKAKIDFESKWQHHSNFYLSKALRSHVKNENQHFIVPWQMEIEEEREIPMEEVCYRED